MKRILLILSAAVLFSCGWRNDVLLIAKRVSSDPGVYGFIMKNIEGLPVPLSRYKGKVLLIVNVASRCGLTPQYKDLQALYLKYRAKGLVVLGFPANDFLNQEPGGNRQIRQFCSLNYGVTFPMFGKISVKGKAIHPLYGYLTVKRRNGVLDAPVKWNFQKFLIGRKGRLVAAIGPARTVLDAAVLRLIRRELDKK